MYIQYNILMYNENHMYGTVRYSQWPMVTILFITTISLTYLLNIQVTRNTQPSNLEKTKLIVSFQKKWLAIDRQAPLINTLDPLLYEHFRTRYSPIFSEVLRQKKITQIFGLIMKAILMYLQSRESVKTSFVAIRNYLKTTSQCLLHITRIALNSTQSP